MPSTALITGATSGIGYELCKLSAAKGTNLILAARNNDRLREQADEWSREYGVIVHTISIDISRQESAQHLHDEIRKLNVPVDILVNNAGFGTYAPFAESSMEEQLRMIQLNITSLVTLTRLLLPGMLARKHGRIMNVSSTAAFQPGPMMAVYYASKAFVLSFSEALGEETRGTGVTVTALCPGPTPTNFQARTGMQNVFLAKGLVPMTSAGQVAREGYAAMAKGRRVCIPGYMNRFGAYGVRFVPTFLLLKIVRRLHVFA